MQTVNPAFYSCEGALRCSAIVNFARGEIPRLFLQKPRAIRSRSSARETFRRKSRKEKGVIGPRGENENVREREKAQNAEKKRKRDFPNCSVNLFYADFAALFNTLPSPKIASSCIEMCRNCNRACISSYKSGDFKTDF